MMEKRKRGAPRRGPFSGNKITFSTKITEDTMERLARSAQASGMSVSQKGEEALMRSLEAEDDFQRHFAPALREYERHIMLTMPPSDLADCLEDWERSARLATTRLAEDMMQSVNAIYTSRKARVAPAPIKPSSQTVAPAASPARKGRPLDLSPDRPSQSRPKPTKRVFDI